MRPQVISIICLIGILGAGASIFMAFTADVFTMDYRIWMLLMAGVQIKAIQGIWQMKKWGVVLYAVKLALVQLGMIMAGFWSAANLMVPVVIMLVLSKYYSAMR